MEKTIEGRIISKDLGVFGKYETVYGYVGIEKPDCEKIKVKVDSFTWYETLEVGSHVFIELDNLGTTEILVARRIDVNLDPIVDLQENATVCV
ncbi:MAG: hypothetical protein RTU63_09940 [Candidatus Thorarchaeota archaeon]